MSAWEDIPTTADAAVIERDGEFDEYMSDVYQDLMRARAERAFHNRDGFFADLAGSEKCLELGHVKPEGGWGEDSDDLHVAGFDGDYLCLATQYGQCCTECEGECSETDVLRMSTRAEFWALFTTPFGSKRNHS